MYFIAPIEQCQCEVRSKQDGNNMIINSARLVSTEAAAAAASAEPITFASLVLTPPTSPLCWRLTVTSIILLTKPFCMNLGVFGGSEQHFVIFSHLSLCICQGLEEVLCKACEALGFKKLTPIQREAVPPALQG